MNQKWPEYAQASFLQAEIKTETEISIVEMLCQRRQTSQHYFIPKSHIPFTDKANDYTTIPKTPEKANWINIPQGEKKCAKAKTVGHHNLGATKVNTSVVSSHHRIFANESRTWKG